MKLRSEHRYKVFGLLAVHPYFDGLGYDTERKGCKKGGERKKEERRERERKKEEREKCERERDRFLETLFYEVLLRL